MRRLVLLLVLVFAASVIFAMPAVSATKRSSTRMITKSGTKYRCYPVTAKKKRAVRRARPARMGAGPARPVVNCPAPVVNVPQQPAPVVNVPQQPAPVVNVPAPPPNTAITVDGSSIYIVRDNQLLILNKSDLCLKNRVSLDQVSTAITTTPSP